MSLPRAARRPARTGLLLIDKPLGMTSHDVVQRVRRIFGQREVGHTGTLDPMASGLMVIALGRATRIARFIEGTVKKYVGTITLGRATTTYDAEGDTTAEASISGIDETKVRTGIAGLVGEMSQRVPAYSAVKVGGERLYRRARRGERVEPPIRTVIVYGMTPVRIDLPEVEIEAIVSKGTYIRSLAVQLGEVLCVPAHLSALRRTAVGTFSVDNAIPLGELTDRQGALFPMSEALAVLPCVVLSAEALLDVRHGRALSAEQLFASGPLEFSSGDAIALLTPDGAVAAVGIALESAGSLRTGRSTFDRAVKYACVLIGGEDVSAEDDARSLGLVDTAETWDVGSEPEKVTTVRKDDSHAAASVAKG